MVAVNQKPWQTIKFKNFVLLQRGFDLPQQDRRNGDYPVVASTSIAAYHDEFKVSAPCVTTGRSGALGEVLYINKNCWPLNTTLWVKDFKGNNPKFVYYKLKTLDLEKFNAGAGVPTLNRNHLDELNIEIPADKESQKDIASLLSAYDDLIENNEKRIKALEEMAQLLYTEWFVKFTFPGHEKAKMMDSGTEYGMIPEGWEIKKFGEVIELAYGKALKGENRTEGNVLVYGSSGLVGTHNEKLVNGPGIVVGRKGNAGAVHWVDDDFYPIDTTYYVKSNLDLHFIYYLLKNHGFVMGDVAVPGLNRSQTYLNAVLLPPTSLITAFSARVSHIFNLVSSLSKKNLWLGKMRDLLISQLITGKRTLSSNTKGTFEKLFVFDNLFPSPKTDENLEAIIKENSSFDPEFIAAHCIESRRDTRDWLEELWVQYHKLAEPGFLERLRKTEFHAMTWQMYLATVLMDKGYEVKPNNGKGPDIEVTINGNKYWIEAVVTTPGNDRNAEGFPASSDIYQSIAPRASRISNALTEKYKIYKEKYLGSVCKNDEPFIVAINGQQTATWMPERALLATVYARGNDQINMHTRDVTYEIKDFYEIIKIDEHGNGKTVPIPMNYFCNDSYKELSGAVYCEKHIINANNFGREPEKNLYFAINAFAINAPTLLDLGNMCSRNNHGIITVIHL